MARILSQSLRTPHSINNQTVNEPVKSLCHADIHVLLQVNKLIQVNQPTTNIFTSPATIKFSFRGKTLLNNLILKT